MFLLIHTRRETPQRPVATDDDVGLAVIGPGEGLAVVGAKVGAAVETEVGTRVGLAVGTRVGLAVGGRG